MLSLESMPNSMISSGQAPDLGRLVPLCYHIGPNLPVPTSFGPGLVGVFFNFGILRYHTPGFAQNDVGGCPFGKTSETGHPICPNWAVQPYLRLDN